MSTIKLANVAALHQPIVGLQEIVLKLLRTLAARWSGLNLMSRAAEGTTPDAEDPLEWRGVPIRNGQVIDYLIATRGVM